MKRFMPAITLCLLPLSAVAYLIYSLETYNSVVHNDCGALICFYMCYIVHRFIDNLEKEQIDDKVHNFYFYCIHIDSLRRFLYRQ